MEIITSNLPSSMNVIDIVEAGGPEQLQVREVSLPQLKSGYLLVKVAAAGVNRPDVLQRKGAYPPPADASPIPGLEIAGTIVAIADDVTEWKLGDKVCALVAGGGYAQYCLVQQDLALPIGNLSFIEAAALPENIFTVWANVFQIGKLTAKETVLIHGGTSGIGSIAIMLAKSIGARVITTVGSDEKAQVALSIGADEVINYRTTDFVEKTLALTENKGVDMVVDLIGGDYVSKNYTVAAKFGRIIQIGVMKGNPENLNLMPLMIKRLTHTGSTMRSRNAQEKAEIAHQLAIHVWPLFQQGKIKPIINKTYPMTEAAEAHRHMESGDLIGKIVLLND